MAESFFVEIWKMHFLARYKWQEYNITIGIKRDCCRWEVKNGTFKRCDWR